MSPEQIESPKISVIISTYNAEEWLKKVLWGFNCQIFKDFEVVVADDGSGPKTKQLLEELSEKVFYKRVIFNIPPIDFYLVSEYDFTIVGFRIVLLGK